jgi:hypothetical protein
MQFLVGKPFNWSASRWVTKATMLALNEFVLEINVQKLAPASFINLLHTHALSPYCPSFLRNGSDMEL